ncbi:hypothetical protein TIFTF001_031339 [Ficus carica]|uniref:Uncharacterized protein n=1 Tax=Ficus carica TaxID=3494 RepID=A0AA88J5C6_FICCA|nr:hypothetical protein TIFTF001_031339 [Ficus carica]
MHSVSSRCCCQSRLLQATGGVETDSSRSAQVLEQVTLLWRLLSALRGLGPLFSSSPSAPVARLLDYWCTLEFHRGINEYPNGLDQVLNVPSEDLHLYWFSQCSRTTPAMGSPSALGTIRGRVLVALVVLVGLLFHGLSKVCKWCGGAALYRITRLDPPCTVVLRLVACKREAPHSKEDTSGVSTKGTPMLKSAFPASSDARATLMGRIPNGLGREWRRSRDKDRYSDRAAWAVHLEKDLLMVGEVLLRPVNWIPMVSA